MSSSRLDKIYRKLLLGKFFTQGWGNPEHIQKLFEFRKNLSKRESCVKMVPSDYPVTILHQQTWKSHRIIEGKFRTPMAMYLPDIVPSEVSDAYFQIIIPRAWKSKAHRPMCIHFAGTGDHYFWRRRNIMAKPLLKEDIGALLLENPFYGLRKPMTQHRSALRNVSDIFVMGGCLILESQVLLRWCEKMGFGPLGVSGLSMGGHMASLAATNWPKPLVLIPCLSWSTASSVFTEGVMSEAINWDLLQQQYLSDSKFYDTLSKSCTIVDDLLECALIRDLQKYLQSAESTSSKTPHEVLVLLNNKENIEKKSLSCLHNLSLSELLKHPLMVNYARQMKKRDKEALWFMRGIMDECTHLKNFSVPFDTSLIIVVCAECDGYVPRKGVSTLNEIWPGCTVRYLDSGHVGAYLWHRNVFIDAIIEGFDKAKQKCSLPSAFLL